MVITNVNQVVYQGDGVTTAFPFTFRIIDATDIKLLLLDSDGTETDITSDYYVDTENDTVHYPGYAPGAEPALSDRPPVLAEGQKLVIYRKLPITQEKDLGDKWPFYVIELGLDKLTMILQDIWDWLGRCLCVSKGKAYEAGDDFDPTVPLAADKVICGNANATGYEAREALMEVNGHWDGEGRQIKGVEDPADNQDAATKKYVDDELDTAIENLQLIADVVVDSGELQHITDQLNAIDDRADDAEDSADAAATSEANALSYKNAAANSATNAANSASSATATATALTNYLATKETLTAPAVDPTLTISGASADAKVVGDNLINIENANGKSLEFLQGNAYKSGENIITTASANRCYVDIRLTNKSIIKGIKAKSGYLFTVYWYTLEDNLRKYVGSAPAFTDYVDVSAYSGLYCLLVVASKTTQTESITPAEAIQNVTFLNQLFVRLSGIDENKNNIIKIHNIVPKRTDAVLENGTPVSASNSHAVCNKNAIQCTKGDTVEFVPVRPNMSGFHYEYVYTLYDASGTALFNTLNASPYNNITIIRDDNVASIKFGILEKQGNTHNDLRKNTYGYIPFILVRKSESMSGEEKKMKDRHNNLLSQARYSATTATPKILTLLHFSDIHTDLRAMYKAMDVWHKYGAKLDDMLHTGDISNINWNDGLQNWITSGCAAQVLNTLGNHDCYINNVFGAANKVDVYNNIFAPYIGNWGVQQPTGVDDSSSPYYCACYYYKDYVVPKIRLVVMDTDYWDEAESAWLTSVLNDAKTNAYSIILACHSPRHITGIAEANFCSYTEVDINNYQSNVANFPSGWLDPVEDFIDAGGEVICMLCGHNHRDHVGFLRDYPNILCFSADTPSSAVAKDTARIWNENNENAYNAITFNATDKLITIVRFYAEIDGHLRPKHVFCYDYANKRIISQW